jgi:hypothetical protein
MASPTGNDRPYSGYEELDLEDEPLTPTIKQDKSPITTARTSISPSTSFSSDRYASPVDVKREEDAWRSSLPSTSTSSASASASASRFSSSTAGLTSPPTLERVSTGTSRASGSISMSGPSGAAVLGVAVVDFNHLVS